MISRENKLMKKKYDVIVVGGGHAGVEAAAAAARMGISTALITHNKDTIGEMSCNPAIGGLGKGHLVREIDALDGLMGQAIDSSGIQFRMLNLSRGPAVQGPRAQADRSLYKGSIQKLLRKQKLLDIIEASVEDIVVEKNILKGVELEKEGIIYCETLVLTAGTFLRGMIRLGVDSYPAGRIGDKPSINLAKSIERLKFSIGRLKTGTPPRILKKTIKFNNLEEQKADKNPKPFSFINKHIHIKQISCFITHTNKRSHNIINKNIHLSPMYSGQIQSMGARYCPSIEDKVKKFSSKDSHQIFLEPEGLDSDVIYPNGISTSLPESVQEEFLHSIKGLENAEIIKPGYAIEYDFINPQELTHNLETKKITNLFFAGQINGTTGYEEAAAQGIIAGINAALKCKKKTSFIIDRSDAYIGVLVDDLVTKGTKEPYRMFTSRSEYRLLLRADNADQRLTPLGINIGCVSETRKKEFEKKLERIKKGFEIIKKNKISPNELNKMGIFINHDGKKRSGFDLLSFKNINFEDIKKIWPETHVLEKDVVEQIEIESQYAGYLDRQRDDIKDFKKEELLILPKNIDYKMVGSLSNEVVEKLTAAQPPTLGAASRISGITPAAIIALLRFVKKIKMKKWLNKLEKKEILIKFLINNKTEAALERYLDLLREFNAHTNIVGKSTLKNPWQSHILDSLQIMPFIKNKDSFVLDLGTGAGIPGLILNICGCKNVILIDSNGKKINFLQKVKNQMQLKNKIILGRIEDINNLKVDIITSRALSKLTNLISYSQKFMKKNTVLIFLKGKTVNEEIIEAKQKWKFEYTIKQSISDSRGKLVCIRSIKKND